MATTEVNSLMKFKDVDGNTTVIYPNTKADNVSGLSEKICNQSVITGGNGNAYTATVDGITSITAGVSFVMIPHTTSTNPHATIDVNGLGPIRIRRRVTSASATTSSGHTYTWLSEGKPVRITYDGTFWIADIPKPSATDLMGSVPIENGGTGADNAAAARTNLGAVSMATATVTLPASGWTAGSGNDGITAMTQITGVTAVTSDNTIIVSPDKQSHVMYGECGVRCYSQSDATLIFVCSEVPAEDLTVNVAILT